MRTTFRSALMLIVPFAFASAAAAQQTTLPQGVTSAMIAQGETLFKGPGICTACHGADAKGVPGLGANLTDDEWLHSDGSYEGIVNTVTHGVASDKSSSGTVMPPKGGSQLTDDQVRAVAAYVWSLSHHGT
jgi:cbb3-type cytochrome c oxidase subunit III